MEEFFALLALITIFTFKEVHGHWSIVGRHRLKLILITEYYNIQKQNCTYCLTCLYIYELMDFCTCIL